MNLDFDFAHLASPPVVAMFSSVLSGWLKCLCYTKSVYSGFYVSNIFISGLLNVYFTEKVSFF